MVRTDFRQKRIVITDVGNVPFFKAKGRLTKRRERRARKTKIRRRK